jgi:hypothetical protein
VDPSASREHLRDFDPDPTGKTGGALIYTDERGVQRRLPADLSELSSQEIAAAARASSYELGAPDLSYAKIAAIERLNELRSAGAVSEENYLKEKRRITGLG